jgi:hypothetical protein
MCCGKPETHLSPAAFIAGIQAGMAWMNASGRGWIPGFGGISTRPAPFSRNMASSASIQALATSGSHVQWLYEFMVMRFSSRNSTKSIPNFSRAYFTKSTT